MTERMAGPISYKMLAILLVLQFTIISVGGAFGFANFSEKFMVNLHEYNRNEVGRGGSIDFIVSVTGERVIYIDVGVDMKGIFNETHGTVYWFKNVELAYGSTALDGLINSSKADYVEIRVYSLEDPSVWEVETLEDAKSVNITVVTDEYEFNTTGDSFRYIKSINGVEEDPGTLTEWQTFFWDFSNERFVYMPVGVDKIELGNHDTFVFIYNKFGGIPLDCCSGAGTWEYEDYPGAK